MERRFQGLTLRSRLVNAGSRDALTLGLGALLQVSGLSCAGIGVLPHSAFAALFAPLQRYLLAKAVVSLVH
jgi:hypothetical protein